MKTEPKSLSLGELVEILNQGTLRGEILEEDLRQELRTTVGDWCWNKLAPDPFKKLRNLPVGRC